MSNWHELAGLVVARLRERAKTLKRIDGGINAGGNGEATSQQTQKPTAWVVPGALASASEGGGVRAIGETTQLVRQEIIVVLEDSDIGGQYAAITRLQRQRDDVVAALFGWTPDKTRWAPFVFGEAVLPNGEPGRGVANFLVKMKTDFVLRRVV